MASVKAYVSPRARKYIATAEGRRKLLTLVVGANRKIYPIEESTAGGIERGKKK